MGSTNRVSPGFAAVRAAFVDQSDKVTSSTGSRKDWEQEETRV